MDRHCPGRGGEDTDCKGHRPAFRDDEHALCLVVLIARVFMCQHRSPSKRKLDLDEVKKEHTPRYFLLNRGPSVAWKAHRTYRYSPRLQGDMSELLGSSSLNFKNVTLILCFTSQNCCVDQEGYLVHVRAMFQL